MTTLYPFKLPASLREKIWGSRDLSPLFGAQPRPIGEAWYTFEENTVVNGELAGHTLGELVEHLGRRLMGSSYEPSSLRRRSAGEAVPHRQETVQFYFPLLAKFLFTSDVLSVQVHPDDEYALAREDGPGKTEMWHVVAAQPGAAVALGLTETMSAVELCRAARNGDIERQLRWIPVRKGETLFIPPGTLHTIGPGLVLCEVQQNSDLTYRFYDFQRLGADGEPRPLHIEQAAAVTRQEPHPGAQQGFLFPALNLSGERWRRELLAACKYFAAERLWWEGTIEYNPDPTRFHLLIFLHGTGQIGTRGGEPYRAGDAYLIPAEAPPFPMEAQSPTEIIRAYVPDLDSLRTELIEAGARQKQINGLLF